MDRIRRTIARGIVCAVVVLCCTNVLSGVEFAGGTGESGDPYQIATAEQLIGMGQDPNLLDKHFVLIKDIDLDPNLPGRVTFDASVIARPDYRISGQAERRYTTIISNPFTGVFNGAGHVIRNLVIAGSEEDAHQVGLFGSVGHQGSVTNLRIENAHVSGGSLIGLLVGTNNGTVSRCALDGVVVATGIAGGMVGSNHGSVAGCKSTATIAGGSFLGGLVGENWDRIASSYAMSRITFRPDTGYGRLRSSGGLVGRNTDTIDFSYAVSVATDPDNPISGLVGENSGCVYLGYWDTQASGAPSSEGGRPKTTQQMMDLNTFRGWGQAGLWVLDDGTDYPRLDWENAGGAPIVDAPHNYAGGSGDPNDPYQIATPEQFVSIAYYRSDWDECFVLTADIDLKDVDPALVYSIGTRERRFEGVFDGEHHTIANFRPMPDGGSYVGVFGYVYGFTPTPEIRALHLTDLNVQGVYATGGLVGFLSRGSIEACSVSGTVSGDMCVGGLVGDSQGQVIASFSEGLVTGRHTVGGLMGRQYADPSTTSCYSFADVAGDEDVGGLVGEHRGGLEYCYAAGRVTGADGIGGLVGVLEAGTVYLCYWDAEVNAHLDNRGGQGRTASELMQTETFRGWGVPGQWTLDDGLDYPRLAWENLPGAPLVTPAERYGGGTGEPNDPYQIWTSEQFRDLAYYAPDWTCDFVLMADIGLHRIETAQIVPIGNALHPFTGTFDGNHHGIWGFRCVRPDSDDVGVFGVLGRKTSTTARRASVSSEPLAGAVLRLHVIVTSEQIEGRSCVGGLVGVSAGTVAECSVNCATVGTAYVGGLIGSNSGIASQSYAITGVSATSQVGGLAGYNRGTVESCYARGTVVGGYDVGGLLGVQDDHAQLTTSYSAVCVDLNPDNPGRSLVPCFGGLVGRDAGEIDACVWNTEIAGTSDGVGNLDPDPAGAVAASTESMQSTTLYASLLWDFENTWTICEGVDYPRLQWGNVDCNSLMMEGKR
ncbi:MAG: GLUG motif-containing protein [Phycisphaerales bacterium]